MEKNVKVRFRGDFEIANIIICLYDMIYLNYIHPSFLKLGWSYDRCIYIVVAYCLDIICYTVTGTVSTQVGTTYHFIVTYVE